MTQPSFLRVAIVTLLAAAVGLPASVAFGQNPDRALQRKGTTVKRYVKSPDGNPESQALYNDYFSKFFFPAMRQMEPESLGEVGELRFDLFKDYLWQASPAVQRDLTARAFRHARLVIGAQVKGLSGKGPEVHPTVAYNAVLVLGGLDAEYGSDNRANRRPPKPLPAANKLLCQVTRGAVDQKLPLFMQAGALVGLQRHAKYVRSLPSDAQKDTFRTLLKAAGQSEFPSDTDEDVRAWIRTQTCQAIANLGTPGPRGVFANTLLKVVADDSLPIGARCEVAGMIGGMKLDNPPGVDFKAGYAALQGVAALLAADGRETVEEYKELNLGGSRSSAMQALLDKERFFIDEEGEVRLQRRTLAARQQQLAAAMTALQAIAGPKANEVQTYAGAFDRVFTVSTDAKSDDFEISDELAAMSKQVEKLTPPGLAPKGSGTKGSGTKGSGTKEGSATKEAGSDTREGSDTKAGSDTK